MCIWKGHSSSIGMVVGGWLVGWSGGSGEIKQTLIQLEARALPRFAFRGETKNNFFLEFMQNHYHCWERHHYKIIVLSGIA